MLMASHMCPVCGYGGLQDTPRSSSGGGSYEICPPCGFEFGVSDDDIGYTYDEWRQEWIVEGMPWRGSQPTPPDWNPIQQLDDLGRS
jgi:hypothetical protein